MVKKLDKLEDELKKMAFKMVQILSHILILKDCSW